MKTLKKGWRRFAFKVVPKAFNIFVILGLIFQPVGPAGVASIAWAIESDAAAAVTADEPEAKPAPAEEEKEAPAAAEEEPAPVADEEATPAATEDESAELVEIVPAETATGTEADEPVVDAPETLPATEEVPAVEEAAPVVSADPIEISTAEEMTAPEVEQNASDIVAEESQETASDTAATAEVPPMSVAPVEAMPAQTCLSASVSEKSDDADWNIAGEKAETKSPVELGVKYVFPLDESVAVVFTCLPSDIAERAPLSIERIKASDIDLPEGTVAVSEYAYDITTEGMENGSFKYDLELPKIASGDFDVSYIEKSVDEVKGKDLKESDVKRVDDERVDNKDFSVEANGLDHFTLFIPTKDVDGANDEPGQKDLTKFSFGLKPGETLKYEATFSWDEQDTTSAIDACVLINTDGDAGVNNAVCVHYNNDGSYETRIYTCDDRTDKPQNCWNAAITTPSVSVFASGTACSVSVTDDDPFSSSNPALTGDDYPNDRTATCDINFDNGTAQITNVCSYPSGPPNSNAGDCLGYTAGGFLQIIKTTSQPTSAIFPFTVSGPSSFSRNVSITGSGTSELISVPTGKYSITEGSVSGWTLQSATCDSGTPSDISGGLGDVDITAGNTIHCTFNNVLQTGTVTVNKTVINHGGSKVAADFAPYTVGTTTVMLGQATMLTAGTYTVSETTDPAYAVTFSSDCPNGQVTVVAGQDKTCTITNEEKPAKLIVTKVVVNDDGGSLRVADFPLFVDQTGVTSGVENVFGTGVHTVSETDKPGYVGTFSGDCYADGTVLLEAGKTKTCTITNDDQAASLTVVKHVVNDNGGTKTAGDFTMNVTGTDVSLGSFAGSETGTTVTLDAGAYSASEGSVAGYAMTSNDCSGTIALGEHKTCTITNDDIQPKLTVIKLVDNSHGGNLESDDFMLHVSGAGVSPADFVGSSTGTQVALDAGSYEVTETLIDGYVPQYSADCRGSIAVGDTKTCTVTNADQAPTLTLVKTVINDNGGTKQVSDFPLFVGNIPVTSGVPVTLAANVAYTVSETNQYGYAASVWGGACAADGTITLKPGEHKTCTITNNDIQPKLTVTKVVNNDGFGTKQVSDFPLFVDGGSVTSGVQKGFNAGIYVVSETNQPGYTGSISGACDANGSVTLSVGDVKSCTITNDDSFGRIIVKKEALPDGSQESFTFNPSWSETNFNLSDGGSKDSGVLVPGTYSVIELAKAGWDLTSAVCSDESPASAISLADGETVTCTFTNTKRGNIVIKKDAVSNHAQDFTFHNNFGNNNPDTFLLDDDSNATGANSTYQNSRTFSVLPGTYAVSEDMVVGWQQESAICDHEETIGSIDVAPGETVTCTFTNEQYAKIILVKNTVGGDGEFDFDATGSGLPADIDLTTVGGTATQVFADLDQDNTYSIQENVPAGWDLGAACTGSNTPASITPDAGETVTCAFTNTKRGRIIIEKQTLPDGNQESFTFNPSWSSMDFNLSDGGSKESALVPGTYSIVESAKSGWDLTSAVCSDRSSISAIRLDAGETVTCVFTNTKRAQLTITKDAIDNDAEDFRFATNFDASPSYGYQSSFDLDDDSNGTLPNTRSFSLVPGAYTVQEAAEDHWKLTGLVCTDEDADNLDARQIAVNLEAGEEVVCTFTNTKLGKIEGYKFDDRDGDGRRDEHESKLNGWKIFIDQNENSRLDDGEPSDVTSGNFWTFALGAYAFDGLLPGEYQVCEELQAGWYNSTPLCQTVVLAPGEEEAVNFGNHQAVKVVASKIMCADESELPNWGVYGGPNITAATAQLWVNTHRSCELVSDWKFQWSYDGIPNPGDNNVSDSVTGWATFGPTNATGVAETTIADLKGDQKIWVRELPQAGYLPFTGYPNVNPVSAEMYCHTDAINYDNWEWIGDPEYGETYHCVAWNVKLGSIDGEKWNDRDADGVRDEGEELLGGWTIYLDLNNDGDRDENEPSDVTDEDDGSFEFAGLVPGHYVVREEMQEGWQQTANRCGVKEEESEEEGQDARFFWPKPESRPGTEVKPGEVVRCLIGNTEIPSLSIEKWNDSTSVEQPGNTVRYHIRVTAHDNDVLGVKVTDLPPAGFIYVSGSAVADQGSLSHVYASPGIWDLGDMTAGQSIELVYDTTIAGTQDAGDYKDLAYARGASEAEAAVLATDLVDADNFVGTHVEVALAETPETVVVPEDNEHKIKEKTVKKTRVLGASTVLPMTGAHTGFLVLSLAALLSGIALLVLARRSRKSFIASESMFKSLAFILVSATCLTVGPAVQAGESGLISAQIETPAAVTDTPDFKIGFVALDIASPARTLEVRCFKVGDATAFDTHTLAVGGSSGDCQVSAAVMPADGDYEFSIKVVTTSGAAESVQSGTVNVKLVGTVPGTPYGYDRHDASCMNTITFTTASDAGKTVKVELYRSLATTFVADAATKVAEQAIGSGVNGSFSVAAPGCSNDSFYALRAVDAYGHGSAFVGDADRNVDTDTVTHTKTKTVEGSSTSQGAIPVTGAGAAGAGEVEGAETTVDEAGEAGSVLGESVEAEGDTDGQGGFMSAHPWLSGFGALILLVLGYILYTRKQNDEEQQ